MSSVSPEENGLHEGNNSLPTNPTELRELQVELARCHSGVDTLWESSPAKLMVEAIFDAFLFAQPSYYPNGTQKYSRTSAAEIIAQQTFPSDVYLSPAVLAFARKRARQALKYGSDRIQLMKMISDT